jgi:hypothetical protein
MVYLTTSAIISTTTTTTTSTSRIMINVKKQIINKYLKQ